MKNYIVCNRLDHGNWNSLYFSFFVSFVSRVCATQSVWAVSVETINWSVKRVLTVRHPKSNTVFSSGLFCAADNKLNFDLAKKKKEIL